MELKEHLIINLDHFKDLCRNELLKRAELLKFEDKLFYDDIQKEFKQKVNYIIVKDLNNRYNIEDILISLEELNYVGLLC